MANRRTSGSPSVAGRLARILVLVALGVGVGWGIWWKADRTWSSTLEVLVRLETSPGASSREVLPDPDRVRDIANRIQSVDRRPLLIMNLRYALKQHLLREAMAVGGPLHQKSTQELRAYIKTAQGELAGLLGSSMEFASPREQMIRMLEPQALLEALREEVSSQAMPSVLVRPSRDDHVMQELAKVVTAEGTRPVHLRQAAVTTLLGKLQNGMDGASEAALKVLAAEAVATPRLLEMGLYGVADGYYRSPLDLTSWMMQLDDGLHVEAVGQNMLRFRCAQTAPAGREPLTHLIVGVASEMARVEYARSLENPSYAVLQEREQALNASAAMRKDLRDALAEKRSEVGTQPGVLEYFDGTAPSHPDVEMYTAIRGERDRIDRDIREERAAIAVLQKYVSAPERRTVKITSETVRHEPTPLVRSLRETLVETEHAREVMLRNSTLAHPLVRELTREIEDLKERIELHTRPPEPIKVEEIRTDTRLQDWKHGIAEKMSHVRGLEARWMQLDEAMRGAQAKADAVAQKREAYQALRLKVQAAEASHETIAGEVKALRSAIGPAVWPVFDVFTAAERPQTPLAPSFGLWLVLGGLFGSCCAMLYLLASRGNQGRRHVLDTRYDVESVLDLPVMAEIPEIAPENMAG